MHATMMAKQNAPPHAAQLPAVVVASVVTVHQPATPLIVEASDTLALATNRILS